jgi:glycine cleavage system H protein
MAKYEVREILRYSKDHAWAKVRPDGAVLVGITDYAQQMMGSLTYADLPEEGKKAVKSEELASIESTKATSAVISPINGTVAEVNADVADDPELINKDPYDAGWLFAITPSDLDADFAGLLDAASYRALLGD